MFWVPLIEIAVSAWPYRFHDPSWRIAIVTSAATVSMTILLALLITYLVGVFAEDRPANWLVAIVGALMVVFCIAGSGAFVLDALQMRAAVQSSAESRYNLASAWALARILLAALGAAILSLNAFRNARSLRRTHDRRGVKAPAVLVSSSSSTPVASGPTS
jgi:hypothetical protein